MICRGGYYKSSSLFYLKGGDDPNGTPAFFYTQNSKKGAVTNE